jgi:hypothetical protein
METRPNERPQSGGKSGCCGCGCGPAMREPEPVRERAAELPEAAKLDSEEESCCGG